MSSSALLSPPFQGGRFGLLLELASENLDKLGAVCDYFKLNQGSANINEFTLELFKRILVKSQQSEWRDADVYYILKIFSFIVQQNVDWSGIVIWKDLCLSLALVVSSCPSKNKSYFIGCATKTFVKVCDETSIQDLLIPIVVAIFNSLDVDNKFYCDALESLLGLLKGRSWDTHTVDHLVSKFSAKILDMKHHRLKVTAIQVLEALVNLESKLLCFKNLHQDISNFFVHMSNDPVEVEKLATMLNNVA